MNAYQRLAERWISRAESKPYRRTPLRTNQHILHLLLTVFTFGLWLPVWIIRAISGNKVPVQPWAA